MIYLVCLEWTNFENLSSYLLPWFILFNMITLDEDIESQQFSNIIYANKDN